MRKLLGKWLHYRNASIVLWVAVVGNLIYAFLPEEWVFSEYMIAPFSIFCYLYAWSSLWKVAVEFDPENKADLFFVLMLISTLYSFFDQTEESPSISIIISMFLGLVGSIGIWRSKLSFFGKKQLFSLWWIMDYAIALIFLLVAESLEKNFYWMNGIMGVIFLTAFIGAHVVSTQILLQAHKQERGMGDPLDQLIDEIGKEANQ